MLSNLLSNEQHFAHVPADWHVIVTDIKNSTIAFRAGRSEEINLIATGCIIAVINLAQKMHLEIPFFFGGDGATIIVPDELLVPALGALKTHRANTLTNFQLELRVGAVSVADLQHAGNELLMSRLYISGAFSIPIVLGNGLSEAESIVKGNDEVVQEVVMDNLDLTGMECRWDKIKPAATSHEVVCLLVSAKEGRSQAATFKKVIDLIDNIYGPHQARNPVSQKGLFVKSTLSKIALEMRARLGRFDLFYLLKNWLVTVFGKLVYFKKETGQHYIQKLVELTDTLVIDGRINTVIAGAMAQRKQLEKELDVLEAAGEIVYGLFVSRESIMSCYVRDRKDKHIHFVDGADGGYTMAATVLKQKLAKG